MKIIAAALLLLLSCVPGRTQTPVAVPPANVPAASGGIAHGALLIVGGGAMGPELWNRFVELAGGTKAHIVVIPTANEDDAIAEDHTTDHLRTLGVAQVTVLHTRDRKTADSAAFVTPLLSATGVWLGGGRQWRLADAYLHTRTQTELNNVLARGGVIGGSSAGATIQGSLLVRGDTRGNEVMEGDHREGFGFLPNSAIDQHVLRRNRQFDLIPVIDAHPELLGIGIDEGTAILVRGNEFEVLGATYVIVHTRPKPGTSPTPTPNNAGTKGKFYLLGKGQQFDLQNRRPK